MSLVFGLKSLTYGLFAFAYFFIMVLIPPRIPFSTRRYMSGLVINSSSIFDIFKAASHARPGAV